MFFILFSNNQFYTDLIKELKIKYFVDVTEVLLIVKCFYYYWVLELAKSKSVSRLLEMLLEEDDNTFLYFERQTYFCVFHGMSAQPYTSTNLESHQIACHTKFFFCKRNKKISSNQKSDQYSCTSSLSRLFLVHTMFFLCHSVWLCKKL